MRLQNLVRAIEDRMQLDPAKVEEIYGEYISSKTPANRVNYKWVEENGVYDITHTFHGSSYYTREFVYNKKIVYVANRYWVEDPIANQELPEWMREPWGTYPNLPEKPL